jgi:coproporphyrinogen III oxidase
MEQPAITKKTKTHFFYEENLSKKEQIAELSNSLVQSTLERLQIKHGNTDTMIRNSKAFDSGLDTSRVKERSLDPIIKEWRETTEEDIFNTLGTEFIFTKISKDVESTFVNRDPLTQMHKKSTVASFFNNGSKHDLYHNTFFKEDILINSSETSDHPGIIIKTYALEKDKLECE